jgi:cytochrome c553
MRKLLAVLVVVSIPAIASATDDLNWAYPVPPKGGPKSDPNEVVQVPGSDRKYTREQINDGFNPPDWFPGDHAPMPKIVANGNRPGVRACALCHLTSGDGHPESSGVSGLPVAYAMRQMAEFKNGGRKGIRATSMIELAQVITDEESRVAAEYFAALKPRPGYTKVVESATVPKTYLVGAMSFATADGATEPIGNRIIVIPQDPAGARARNPRTGFTSHVPPGSIARGEALAMTGGGGKTIPCAICHGQGLKGLGEVPAIANRTPLYLFRQLNDMKTGMRSGPAAALMTATVEKLTVADMIALSAYAGSLEP